MIGNLKTIPAACVAFETAFMAFQLANGQTVRGSFSNSGLTACLLAVCAVFLMDYVRDSRGKERAALMGTAALAAAGIIVLGSRAAILALAAGLAIIYRKSFSRRSALIAVVSLPVAAAVLYRIRPASALSRLFIWRVSLGMAAEKPLFGWGFNGFEHNYMFRQAEFLKNAADPKYGLIANDVAYPYSEFLHLLVNFGIVGTLMVAAVIFFALRKGLRSGSGCSAPTVALLMFSLFSYPMSDMRLTALFVTLLTVQLPGRVTWGKACVIGAAALSVSLPFLFKKQLIKEIGRRDFSGVNERVMSIWPDVADLYGQVSGNELDTYRYAPSCGACCAAGDLRLSKRDTLEAERLYVLAAGMVPTRMKPNHRLFKLYQKTGETDKLNAVVERVSRTKLKVMNSEGIRMRSEIMGGMDSVCKAFIGEYLPQHSGWKDIAMTPEVDEYFKWVADNLEHSRDTVWQKKAGAVWDTLALKGVHQSVTDSLSPERMDENIRIALDDWRQGPYASNLSVDEFKEMLLPFITTSELVQTDRSWIRRYFAPVLGTDRGASAREATENYRDWIKECRHLSSRGTFKKTDLGVYEMMMPPQRLDCHYFASVTCDIFRACGIPAVMEFTPKWPDRARGHFWCAVPDTNGVLSPFSAPYNSLMQDWDPYLQGAGKIYRFNYSVQDDSPAFLTGTKEYLPPKFENPLISDQTWRYHRTVDLTVPFHAETDCNLAWLCFFEVSVTGLAPAAWGKIDKKRHSVTFGQVPADVVFFPVFYDDGEIVPFAPPFYVDGKGAAHKAQRPMSTKIGEARKVVKTKRVKEYDVRRGRQSMLLSRKYPDKTRMRAFWHDMPGTCILGADLPEGPFDTLGVIVSAPGPYLQDIALYGTDKGYRYFKFCSPEGKKLNIGHVELLCAGEDCPEAAMKPSPLPLFSPEDVSNAKPDTLFRLRLTPASADAEKVLDDDLETFTDKKTILLDAGVPVKAKVLRFAPRNACNIVVPGDTYALYYYDLGWQLHSRQVAKYNFVEFDDVPKGTLYRLANETEGVEELPFAYENGEQKFINNYNPGRIEQ